MAGMAPTPGADRVDQGKTEDIPIELHRLAELPGRACAVIDAIQPEFDPVVLGPLQDRNIDIPGAIVTLRGECGIRSCSFVERIVSHLQPPSQICVVP